MTTSPTPIAASQQAAVDAALLILERMGLSPDDLTTTTKQRPPVPTFADYVPVVSATVTDGTRKAYGSYWNQVVDQWDTRRLDEPTPSEIKQLVAYVRANVVPCATPAAAAAQPRTSSPRSAAFTSTPKTTG
jgi:integrase/recombinase XerC